MSFKKILLLLGAVLIIGGGASFFYVSHNLSACLNGKGKETVEACAKIVRLTSFSENKIIALYRSQALTTKILKLADMGETQKACDDALVLLATTQKMGHPQGISVSYGLLCTFLPKLGDRYADTVKYCTQAVAGDLPAGSLEAFHYNIGYADLKLKNYADAISHLQKAGQPGDNKPELIYSLGAAYMNVNDDAKALEYFSQVEQDIKKYPDLHENLGRVSFRLGQYEAAASYLDKAVQEVKDCADCSTMLTQAREMLKKQKQRPLKRGKTRK